MLSRTPVGGASQKSGLRPNALPLHNVRYRRRKTLGPRAIARWPALRQTPRRVTRGPRAKPIKSHRKDIEAPPPLNRWWSQTGSNRRPHACKARALPTELWPRRQRDMVGLGGLEPPTSRLSSARSNQLSYKPAPEDRGRRPRRAADSVRQGLRRPISGMKERRRRRGPAKTRLRQSRS